MSVQSHVSGVDTDTRHKGTHNKLQGICDKVSVQSHASGVDCMVVVSWSNRNAT